MSHRAMLTDDAIRAALSVGADVRAPADLGEAIRSAIEETPQRRSLWASWTVSPRTRRVLRLAVMLVLLVALIGALLLVGAPRGKPAAVTTFAGGPARDGVMPGPAPDRIPALEWGPVPIGPLGPWSPAIMAGTIYNADGRGIIVALDAATGEPHWEVQVGAPLNSGLTLADGLALVGDVDGVIHALDLDSQGTERWAYDAGGRMAGPPTVLEGVAYVGTLDGYLHAFDAATGAAAWTAPVPTAGPVSRSLAAADGLVYVASSGATSGTPATLAAHDAATGALRWSQILQTGSPGSPMAADGRVFVPGGLDTGSDTPALHAFDASTGEPAWSTSFRSPTGAALYRAAATAGLVFVISLDGHAYALDAAAGDVRWSANIEPGESPNGAWVDGVLYVTGAGEMVVALDAATGAEVWRVPLEASARAPAIVDGRIVVATDAATILSLADDPSA